MEKIIPSTLAHASAIATLINETMGAGRYVRTAERIREHTPPIASLSHVCVNEKEEILASILYSPIRIENLAGLMLGPLAVSPAAHGRGIGVKIMQHTLILAEGLENFQFVLLVGDLPYYQRVGFTIAPKQVLMPGPVDPTRLLIRPLNTTLPLLAGKVCAAPDLC